MAEALHGRSLGTLLFDLLEPPEAEDRANVFDIGSLAQRLLAATAWVRAVPECEALPIGYFGASTGAAAALVAAVAPGSPVAAVVSRGGRPDLAEAVLASVRAPTLLIVGGVDTQVLELNQDAQRQLQRSNRLSVVAGATHLFEEPGTLEAVAALAGDWFRDHLRNASHAAS